MYFVNNEFATVGVGDFQLQENDSITLYFVTDYMTNTFTWFNKEFVEVNADEEFKIELMGDNYGDIQPVKNAVILVNDEPFEIDLKRLLRMSRVLQRYDLIHQVNITYLRNDLKVNVVISLALIAK